MKILLLLVLHSIFLVGFAQEPIKSFEDFIKNKNFNFERINASIGNSDTVIFIAENAFIFVGHIIVLNRNQPILFKLQEDTIRKNVRVFQLKEQCLFDRIYQTSQLVEYEPPKGKKGTKQSHDYEIEIAIKAEDSFTLKRIRYSEINIQENLILKCIMIDLGRIKSRCFEEVMYGR
jgi:hypothetical protein